MLTAAVLAGMAFFWARYIEPRLLTVTRHDIPVVGLPEGLDGTRIVLLSDLHGASFGQDQERLRAAVERQNPDAVVFAGDLIDANRGGLDEGIALLKALAPIAPTYVVWGNHDYIAGLPEIRDRIRTAGIRLSDLDDRGWATLQLPGGKLLFAGMSRSWRSSVTGLAETVRAGRASAGKDTPLVVVVHSPGPNPVAQALAQSADLVLAGHTHGGQIRLPFIGAIWSPVDGFFSRTAYGLRQLEHGYLFTTRGLGNSVWPVRFFCPPEVAVLTLRRAAGR